MAHFDFGRSNAIRPDHSRCCRLPAAWNPQRSPTRAGRVLFWPDGRRDGLRQRRVLQDRARHSGFHTRKRGPRRARGRPGAVYCLRFRPTGVRRRHLRVQGRNSAAQPRIRGRAFAAASVFSGRCQVMPRLLFVLTSFLFLPIAVIASSGSSGRAVGTIAPDFSARNLLTGEKIPLSKQRGKVVILTFWASWCGPCRRELPILEQNAD